MPERMDILDQQDSLRGSFVQSIVLHAAVFGALIVSTMTFQSHRDIFGGQTHFGDAVPVSVVNSIPLPQRPGPKNPVANDTESQVQQAPKPEPKHQVRVPDEKAIPIKAKDLKKQPRQQSQQIYRQHPLRENELTSSQAPAAQTPIFQKPGGEVGLGQNNTLGSRFGAYADLVAQRVTEKWQNSALAGQMTPVAVITFEIQRDGSIRNAKVAQSSGNSTMDFSALRAVMDASPFPPLPAGYERNVAGVELQFQLKR
ncbi:MAG TPA: TonB family protein [Bryobacteraceae bacterium]|nr:TonB family protein [Bryobacteraceae bacterium]